MLLPGWPGGGERGEETDRPVCQPAAAERRHNELGGKEGRKPWGEAPWRDPGVRRELRWPRPGSPRVAPAPPPGCSVIPRTPRHCPHPPPCWGRGSPCRSRASGALQTGSPSPGSGLGTVARAEAWHWWWRSSWT